jgi:hypothetical protein
MFAHSSRATGRHADATGTSFGRCQEGALVKQLVKQVRLNNLQYNANRDPQVYRRTANEAFRIQAVIGGSGAAKVTLADAEGKTIAAASVEAPGTFTHEVRYPTPGTRIVLLEVSRGGETFRQDLRLDVLDHAWIG